MLKQVKPIDEDHIAIIETQVTEQLVARVTLEARKAELQKQIAEIDEQLTLFVAKK